MRVSSLSDAHVIALIARYFVPVWQSRDAYQLARPSDEERAELLRIDRERDKRGLRGGTVCVFLLSADGSVAATQPVQQACHAENLVPFLEQFVQKEKLQPRNDAAVQRTRIASRAARPPTLPGTLVLHTWTRFDDGTPNLGTSQDWVAWTAAEWRQLLPAGAAAGSSVQVPRAVADQLFARCYPPGPYWNVNNGKMVDSQLRATVLGGSSREVRIKLEGRLALIHPFEDKETDRHVKANVLGFVRYDPERQAITSFVLASEEAESVSSWEGRPTARKMRFGVTSESAK
jgi:hypothetical protein